MTTIDLYPHQIPPLVPKPDEKQLEPAPLLAGARFLGDPTAPLDIADWPEELR
jgi:hypothetical protein